MLTHVPPVIDPPETTPDVTRTFDWFTVAAVLTWLVVGAWPLVEMVRGRFEHGGAVTYVASFAMFGAAMFVILFLPRSRWTPPRLLAVTLALVETITGLAMNVVTQRYLNGTGAGMGLLVIVAAQLPYFLPGAAVWTWIGVQTFVLTAIFFPSFPTEALTLGVAIGGFQIFAAASSILAINEGRARTNLARANAELRATRELLAEGSRTAERLRISRDLHDTLGHHLAALSLQLDVSARLTEGTAHEHIRQAHAITRLLLSDVRDVVSTLRETSRMNLADAIRALTVQPMTARVHLDIPATVLVDDPQRAEAILRAVQEILTNTARHAHAANLWVRLALSPNGLTLQARDDGRGAAVLHWGNGLRGMRERFEQHGGRVDVVPAATGFEIRAMMPVSPSA